MARPRTDKIYAFCVCMCEIMYQYADALTHETVTFDSLNVHSIE